MSIRARAWFNEKGIQRDGKGFGLGFFDITDFFRALFR
jgi:hypothetical protein